MRGLLGGYFYALTAAIFTVYKSNCLSDCPSVRLFVRPVRDFSQKCTLGLLLSRHLLYSIEFDSFVLKNTNDILRAAHRFAEPSQHINCATERIRNT